MSNENQNTILKFDTLLGEDTLKKHLEHILNLTNRITNSLTIEDGKNVTLAQLKSIKNYLTEIHELSRIKLTLEGTGKKLGGEYGSYGNIQEIMAELKALRTQLGVQQQLSTKQASELKAKAFQGADLTGYDASNPQHRKAVKEGLEQRSTIVKLNKDQIDTLKKINETELAILAAKREEARNVRKQQRQTDALEKRTTDEKRNILAQHMREAKEGTLTKTSLRSNYKEDERGLKAIALSASKAQYDTTLSEKQKTKARAVAIEAQKLLDTLEQKKVTSKLSSPKGLSFFEKLTTTDLARAKGETEIQNLRAYIKLLKRQGKEEERLKLHETLVGAKKIMATKFAPVSPYQEAFTKEKKAAISLGRLSPDAIKTLTQDEVTKHLKASEIRSHKTLAPFGSKEHALELEYQKALKQRIQAINDEAQAAKKVADARLKEELNRQKEVDKTLNRAGKLSLAPLESAPQYTVEAKKQLKSDLFKKARTGELSEKDLQEFIHAGLGDKSRLLKELKSLQTQTRKAELDPNLITTLDNAPKKLNSAISGVIAQLNLEQETVKGAAQAAKKVAEARLKEELDRQKDEAKATKKRKEQEDKITNNRLAQVRDQARRNVLVAGDIRSQKDPQLLRQMFKGYSERAYDRSLSPTDRSNAVDMRSIVSEQLKAIRPAKVLDEVAKHAALNREARNIELLDPKHANTSTELGTRAIQQKTAQLERNKALEKAAANEYKTLGSLANLDATQLAQATRIVNYRKNIAAANSAQEREQLALLDEIKRQKALITEANKEAKKAAKYQQRLANDPSFAASERLKGEKGALVAGSVDARSKSQQLGDTRLQAKVAAEQEKILAIAEQRYHTEDKIRALQPEQVKHARDTLNYHAETVQHIKAEREQVEKLRLLFNEIHGTSNKRAAQAGLIADLEKTHYKTKESLRNLGREELQQAIEVLKYRTKTVAATEQQRAEAQHLLNLANQQYKLNPENQAEHRQSNVTRVLGDSGASLLLIQSGLMLNYKLLGGIQSLFSGAIDSAIKLDSAFRQLQAISAATNYEMAALKVNLINVAQASKFSAAEVGETAVLLAQAGLSTQEIGASMKGVITLAQATGTDLAKSVDVVTSVLSVFNKSASETNNIVNQLTEALNRSKLDIQKVALGIQYAGNISADAGISFEELTSALGAMANAGIRSGSTLGTGLRQMIIDLEKPSEKLKARLRFLGVSLDEVDLRANGLEGTLKNLREAGFTTADAFQTFEVRSAAAFAALTGNLDDFHGLQEALADTNAAFDANYVQMEALAVQIDHLKSNLGIVAAEGLKPVTALMRDLAKATSHAMENAEEGSGVLRVFSTALASMVTGVTIGWLTSLIIRLYEVIAAARLAAATATGFGAALLASGPVIAGVVAAIGLFTAAAYSYSSEMDRLNDKLDKAKGKFNEQKEILATTKDNLQNVGTAISNLTSKYGELSEDHSALTTQALQLEKQFGSMGFTIDNLANLSVPELMRKLRELRAELSQKYDMELGETMKKALDEIKARRETADEKLKQKEFTPAGLRAAAEGYKGYIGNVYKDTGNDRDVREAAAQAYQNRRDIGNSPEAEAVSKMVAALFNKTATAIENAKGTEIKSSQLNLDYEKALIVSSAAYRSQTVSSEAVTEALDKLTDTVAAYNVKATSSKQAELTVKKYKRDQQLNRFTSAMNDPVAAFAQGEQDLASYQEFKSQEQIKKNTVKGDKGAALDAYTISVGKRAAIEKSKLQPYIGAIQTKVESLRKQLKQLKETDANYGAVNLELTAKQTELEEFRKLEANYRDEIASYEELTTKNSANALKKKLDSLKKQYELLKKRYADDYTSKGSKNLEGELSRKLGEINEIEKQIAALDKSPKEAIVAATMNAETARQSLSDLVKDQQGRLKEYKASKAAALKDFLTDKDYEAYKKGYEDWFKAQELSDKLWESSQRSQAEQLKYRTQGILSSSAMFSEINSDLKKQAQVQANATGISQEYSKYGSGAGGYFARQAAKKAEAKNNLKRQQEKLARSLTSEKAYSDKALEIAPNFEITQQALREASDTLIAKMQESKDLTKPKDIMEAELKTAQQNFDLLKRLHDTQNSLLEQAVKGKEEAHARAQEAIDALEATVFNPIDELTKSLRAGQEAMSSGLSTIMGDWASGMIKNTEDVRDAFEAMGKSILQSMLKVITDRTATMFTDMLLGKADDSTGLGILGKIGSSILGGMGFGTGEVSLGLSQGGFLNGNHQGARHYAGGGHVSGTDIGHDIIPAYLRPKEYVLKPTATSALGKPFLDRLNSVTTGSLKQLEGKAQAQAPQISVVQSPPTNIYVVSPDQQRQMSPQDVVITLEDNISRGGSIKRLIKQVISGEV